MENLKSDFIPGCQGERKKKDPICLVHTRQTSKHNGFMFCECLVFLFNYSGRNYRLSKYSKAVFRYILCVYPIIFWCTVSFSCRDSLKWLDIAAAEMKEKCLMEMYRFRHRTIRCDCCCCFRHLFLVSW